MTKTEYIVNKCFEYFWLIFSIAGLVAIVGFGAWWQIWTVFIGALLFISHHAQNAKDKKRITQ